MSTIDPYNILASSWSEVASIESILSRPGRYVTVSGENAIHAAGFFADLKQVAAALGNDNWWLLDLDGDGRRHIEFNKDDNEQSYFSKLQSAPEWAPGRPFPYAVRCQCFLGPDGWILLSDRDLDRMHFIAKDLSSPKAVNSIIALVRS